MSRSRFRLYQLIERYAAHLHDVNWFVQRTVVTLGRDSAKPQGNGVVRTRIDRHLSWTEKWISWDG